MFYRHQLPRCGNPFPSIPFPPSAVFILGKGWLKWLKSLRGEGWLWNPIVFFCLRLYWCSNSSSSSVQPNNGVGETEASVGGQEGDRRGEKELPASSMSSTGLLCRILTIKSPWCTDYTCWVPAPWTDIGGCENLTLNYMYSVPLSPEVSKMKHLLSFECKCPNLWGP